MQNTIFKLGSVAVDKNGDKWICYGHNLNGSYYAFIKEPKSISEPIERFVSDDLLVILRKMRPVDVILTIRDDTDHSDNCPVPTGSRTTVVFRNGVIETDEYPESWDWSIDSKNQGTMDIIAFRMIVPVIRM